MPSGQNLSGRNLREGSNMFNFFKKTTQLIFSFVLERY